MALEIDVSEHSPWLTQYAPAPAPAKACNEDIQQSQVPAHKSCKKMCELCIPCDGSVNFDCSICLEVCHEPVVTMCGHLFCWSCLNCWLSFYCDAKECPVCKADVDDKLVRLYGHGKVSQSNSTSEELSPACRSSDSPSIAQIAQAITSYGYYPSNGYLISEMHLVCLALLGFFASLAAKFGWTCLPIGSVSDAGAGFLCRRTGTNAALFAQWRRRLNMEKEYALHWAFICVASVAIVYFLTY